MGKLSIIASAAFLCAFSAVGAANARSIGAWVGHAQDPTKETCMRSGWAIGGITNSCGGTASVKWDIELEVDSAKAYTVAVDGFASASSGCYAYAISHDTASVWQSYQQFYGYGKSSQVINVVSPSVPNGGFLLLECLVYPGESLRGINWL